jgi:hypothetical protein
MRRMLLMQRLKLLRIVQLLSTKPKIPLLLLKRPPRARRQRSTSLLQVKRATRWTSTPPKKAYLYQKFLPEKSALVHQKLLSLLSKPKRPPLSKICSPEIFVRVFVVLLPGVLAVSTISRCFLQPLASELGTMGF